MSRFRTHSSTGVPIRIVQEQALRSGQRWRPGGRHRPLEKRPRNGLRWADVVARTPVFFTGDAVEVLFNKLLSPRQSIASAHVEIMADRDNGWCNRAFNQQYCEVCSTISHPSRDSKSLAAC